MDHRSMVMKMTYQSQKPKVHILTPEQAASLLAHIEICIHEEGCNHTHRFCQAWLDKHMDFMQHHAVLNELEDMDGFCDCAVLYNCYEDYNL